MKKLTVNLICFLVIALYAHSQDSAYTYYDAAWKETSKDKAAYTRVKFKNGSDWSVIDRFKSGAIQMKGSFSNDSCTIKNGSFTWFHDNGLPYHSAEFKNDRQAGKETLYYEDGKKQAEGVHADNGAEHDWISYFPSGTVSGKAHYKGDDQVSASFFNEDGSPNKTLKVFMQESKFPGGDRGWAQYLQSEMNYPKKAVKNEIQGTVVVQFIVTENGAISNVEVAKSVDPLLDAEAVRVVKKMPSWQPAFFAGRNVKSYKKQPITFRLQ